MNPRDQRKGCPERGDRRYDYNAGSGNRKVVAAPLSRGAGPARDDLSIVTRRSVWLGLVEAGPLIVFLVCYKIADPVTPQEWLAPYVGGAGVALIVMGLLRWKRIGLDPVFVGINVYLLIGGVALLARHAGLIRLYATLQASGMLAGIVAVGVVYAIYSSRGFIGLVGGDRRRVRIYSGYFLLVALLMFGWSFQFRGELLLSEVVPFTVLFAGRGVLRSMAYRSGSACY